MREYLTKEWLPAIEHTIRPTTYRSYVAHVECHILPALGSLQLQKLAPAQINALYAKLGRSGKRNGQGLTALSVRHVHAVLHRALKDAVRWGRLARNPADLADPPRVAAHGHELRTWSAEQLAAFLSSQRDDRLYALWHTLAMTGLRRGEALGLRWEDVDLRPDGLQSGARSFPVAERSWSASPRRHGDGGSWPWTRRRSQCLKGRLPGSSRSSRADGVDDTGLVFTSKDGAALHPEVVSRCFRKAEKKAMLPVIRLHDLRTPTPRWPCGPASIPRWSASASATPRSRSRSIPTGTPSRRCRKRRRRDRGAGVQAGVT